MKRHAAKNDAYTAEDRPVAVNSRLTPEKRQQVLQGAMRAFMTYGYEGTSMDKVASEAGTSKPTIYSHFKDKEALFAALIEEVSLRFVSGNHDYSIFELDPPAFLSRFASNFLRRMDDWEYISFMRLLVGESGRFPELSHLYVTRVIQPSMKRVTDYFANQAALNFPDPETAARIFVGALNAHIMSQEILGAKFYLQMPRERFVKTLVDMILLSSDGYKEA